MFSATSSFSRRPGLCFEQIPTVGSPQITLVKSRYPISSRIGSEINLGDIGYTFPITSDSYEIEIHFIQPFVLKYVFMSNQANVENFKVDASHAGMLGVFCAKSTQYGLVVDGFPTMLVSMIVISITQTINGAIPGGITLSIVIYLLHNCIRVQNIRLNFVFRFYPRVFVIQYIRHRM